MQNELKDYIANLNEEFIETHCGFANVSTGEIFTKTEVQKYLQKKIEEFNTLRNAEVSFVARENGIELEQRLVTKKSKPKTRKLKDRYDGGDFNMVYRERLGDNVVKLSATEKGVWYSLGELATYPTNTVMIKGEVPNLEQVADYVGMSERNLRRYITKLCEMNLIKVTQCGYKKAIVINPEYYATGKDLDIETLRLFNIVECDEEKIESYL